jgi:hypothetical protein
MKLRLLLFEDCKRHCPGCCNKQFELDKLPVCNHWTDWDQIILTGGELMLRPDYVSGVIDTIRAITKTPIFLYTAMTSNEIELLEILRRIDGITVTLHEQSDFRDFYRLHVCMTAEDRKKSLRLNVFKEVNLNGILLPGWEVKDNITWIKDCPLPSDEQFMRLPVFKSIKI